MAITYGQYANGRKNIENGTIDIDTDTIKALLTTSSYTPTDNTDEYVSDTSNELSAGGYARQTLNNVSVTQSTGTVTVDADDLTFSSISENAYYLVVFKDTGNDATSPLLFYIDFGEDKNPNGNNLEVAWHADGLYEVT